MEFLRKLVKFIDTHRWLSIFVILVIIVSSYFTLALAKKSEGVFTPPVVRATIIESVYGIGTITANKIWRVSPGIVSTVSRLWVNEGDQVKKGAPLIQSDGKIWSAPFAGTITSLPFKLGENVFAGVPILTLIDLSDRYLVVSMEQQGAIRVQAGEKARLSFDTIREQSYEGTVVAVYSNETNYLARISVTSVPRQILPGMTADTAIEIAVHDNALLGSTSALEGGKFVWRKRGHEIPTRIEIKVGIIDKDKFEILSGDLAEGDLLLIRKDLNP